MAVAECLEMTFLIFVCVFFGAINAKLIVGEGRGEGGLGDEYL